MKTKHLNAFDDGASGDILFWGGGKKQNAYLNHFYASFPGREKAERESGRYNTTLDVLTRILPQRFFFIYFK